MDVLSPDDVKHEVPQAKKGTVSFQHEIAVIDCQQKDCGQKFSRAMHDIGFAVLKNHSLDYGLVKTVYNKWKDFFQKEDKSAYQFNEKTHDGYVSVEQAETAKGHTTKDIKEFYHFYLAGRCPLSLRLDTLQLFIKLEAIACKLLAFMQQSLPQDIVNNLYCPLPEMVRNCKHSLLRPIHYPPQKVAPAAGAIRAAAHEDICMLTLIASATSPGLQVLNKQGTWLDVPCDPSYIIVNAGDCLQECTQGFYPSTTHRVINPEGDLAMKSRLSAPLFLHAHNEVVLSKQHTAASYRAERFRELGLLHDEDEAE